MTLSTSGSRRHFAVRLGRRDGSEACARRQTAARHEGEITIRPNALWRASHKSQAFSTSNTISAFLHVRYHFLCDPIIKKLWAISLTNFFSKAHVRLPSPHIPCLTPAFQMLLKLIVKNRLFERGASKVGFDFLADTFWDKYLDFEERLEDVNRYFAILSRIIHIPMHQYARYFERYRQLAHTRTPAELLPPEVLAQHRAEIEMAASPNKLSEHEVDTELRARTDNYLLQTFHKCQAETTKRWTYEQEIKRPYFHVTELDEAQLSNWRKYLDFEEAEGDYQRITFLYERCLVAAAYYDEFWLRYARWMYAQPNKTEEVRNIYQRASCIYIPIARSTVRLQWALFEEMQSRVDVALAIYEAMLVAIPGTVETIVSWANCARRHHGLDAAIAVYKAQIESNEVDKSAKAALTAEWARLLWKVKGSADDARNIYKSNQQYYSDSQSFWNSFLNFELEQPTSEATEDKQYARIKQVHQDIRKSRTLSVEASKQLIQVYMVYLLERGTKDAAKEYLDLDKEING